MSSVVAPARRFPGKPFAIGFGTFLIVGTICVFFFARRAELARQEALEQQAEAAGVATPE